MKEWKRTHCSRFDHGGCGLKVLVEDGKAIQVLPDESNQRSKGYVCPKGLASLKRIYHPKRLLSPLMRKGKRGQGAWEEISWDRALEFAATSLNRLKEEYGASSIAFGQGAPKGFEYCLMMRLANVFGTPNVAGTQHVCHWPRELMGRFTCGFLPLPDYDNPTQCIMLWGSNPFATNEEGILGIHLKNSLENGAPSLIVIDPLKTDVASRADLWLQIKPGADDLLAIGMLNIIINEGIYDKSFVGEWTEGFEQLKEHVQAYPLDKISAATWIPKEKILKAARLYAESTPAVLHAGNSVENNGINTSQACRALICLMAVTGNLDIPGGNIQTMFPEVMSLRKFIGVDHFHGTKDESLKNYYGISPRLPLLPSSLLIQTIRTEIPYPVKALFLQASNPLISYAGAPAVFEALGKLEFLMVSDLFMTPTAALADLVLPAATNMEYNDIGHYGLPHGYILPRPGIVTPQGDCWSDAKIINELAWHLGYGEFFWKDIQECLEEILAPSGLSYLAFCKEGILKGKKIYYKYMESGFGTPSGKVELYSSIIERAGGNPLPSAIFPEETDTLYPLLMTNAKPRRFFHSAYRHIDSLRRKHGKPSIRIHPKTALKYLISEGDDVHVITRNGKIKLNARLTESLHPNVVMVDYGWWFPEMGEERLFGWDICNINLLTSADPPYDPIIGTTALRGLPCRVQCAT